jgi:hypothetical protein
MENSGEIKHSLTLMDRMLNPRHLAFWGLLGSIAGVLSLIVATLALKSDNSARVNALGSPSSSAAYASLEPTITASPSEATPSPGEPEASPSVQEAGPPGAVINYLADSEPIGDGIDSGTQNLDGSIYAHSLYALTCPSACGSPTCQYDLSRMWTSFHAVIGLNDDADPTVVLQFEVFADEKQVGEAHRLRLGQHLKFAANVAGVLRLKLVITRISGNGQATAVWGDAALTR